MKIRLAALAALAALVGCTPTGSEPAPAQTVEVPGGTPQACLDALDRAEEVFAISAEVTDLTSGLMRDVFPAAVMSAYVQDASGIDQATADLEIFASKIQDATSRIKRIDYSSAAAECRGQR